MQDTEELQKRLRSIERHARFIRDTARGSWGMKETDWLVRKCDQILGEAKFPTGDLDPFSDARLLDFLDGPDVHVSRRREDLTRSDPCVEKAVVCIVDGRLMITEGSSTREAVKAAIVAKEEYEMRAAHFDLALGNDSSPPPFSTQSVPKNTGESGPLTNDL